MLIHQKLLVRLVAALFAAFACLLSLQAQAAELVLHSGKVVTVDERHGTVQALAARGGRILAVGSNEEIRKLIGEGTKVINLRGRTAIPGFIEGHAHFTGVGNATLILDLSKVDSWDQVVDMVAEAAKRTAPGEWILGRGWHQEKWSKQPAGNVKGFPPHDSMSAATPDNPVALTHASGHASFFNQKAMQMAGVDSNTKSPAGGEIIKNAKGEPIGVFSETAAGLVSRARSAGGLRSSPESRSKKLRRQIDLAIEECLSKGVTSFQDAGSSFATIDVYRELAERGELGVRLWVMIRTSNRDLEQNLKDYRMVDAGDHFLTVRAVKRSIDGALGSRGAWLLEPYSDEPESSGLETASVASVTRMAELGARHGFQVCVHAIGDRANREVLDIYEKVWGKRHNGPALRWRIEHAQHIHRDDIPRFGQMGVIASMQGVHCTSDAPYVQPRLGEQRAEEGAYVWQKLLQSGAVVTNGTDAPVEDVDPLVSFYASVTRKGKSGVAFYPEQAMSRMEALYSYTMACAYAAFEEGSKGSLTPGKLADIVILSKDIMTVPEAEILDTQVLYTIVGGKVVYDASK
ncbi:MAG: putative amidohydrolase YtcJ [Planctomycetota bacterium]|jgi:predicted amidohydrolase YtcJ